MSIFCRRKPESVTHVIRTPLPNLTKPRAPRYQEIILSAYDCTLEPGERIATKEPGSDIGFIYDGERETGFTVKMLAATSDKKKPHDGAVMCRYCKMINSAFDKHCTQCGAPL